MQFDPVKAGLVLFESGLSRSNPVCASLVRFKPVWSGLSRSNLVSSGLVWFDPVKAGVVRFDPFELVCSGLTRLKPV